MRLTIEKLVYGGDGLARGPADERGRGKAVFVPFVLPGEQVEASIVEQKLGFMRARTDQRLQSSPMRVEPHCPYFTQCGGCHYQHTGYEHQLEIKRGILGETLQRLARMEPPEIVVHPSPPWQYRNRTRMQLRAGGNAGDGGFALGYYRFNSHELLPVEQCPISSPLVNRAIAALWELGRTGLVCDAVLEIEFFANAADNQMLVELSLPDQYWTKQTKPSLLEFVGELRRLLPEIVGVSAFRPAVMGALVREEVPKNLKDAFGADELVYNSRSCEYHVSAGSFFQTNRYLTDTLLELVTAGRAGESALDLYAGTGLFTLPLSQEFREVMAVEAAPFSFHDLRRNTPSNVKAYRETTEQFLHRGGDHWTTHFDVVVVDPPRSGLGEAVARELSRLFASRLTYVSCDPATLARDLRLLLAAGFRVEEIHLVDLFPQTFHLESVVQLTR